MKLFLVVTNKGGVDVETSQGNNALSVLVVCCCEAGRSRGEKPVQLGPLGGCELRASSVSDRDGV